MPVSVETLTVHVKFIARGTGSAKATVDYLLGERDAAGELRDGVEVRRGDPDMVAAVADTLEFEHKYTSGVIAWAPEDRPTDAHGVPQKQSKRSSTSSSRRPGPASSPTVTLGAFPQGQFRTGATPTWRGGCGTPGGTPGATLP